MSAELNPECGVKPTRAGNPSLRSIGAFTVPLRTAKLTDNEVLLLRARKARGELIDPRVEADRFQCGPETIRKILRGDTFRHLLRETPTAPTGPVVNLPESEIEASLSRFLAEVKQATPLENPDADIQALLGNPRAIP